MAYEIRLNTGSLFKNDRKETDTHADYKGSGLVDGMGEIWIDAWINTDRNGGKYMSLKFKRKNEGAAHEPRSQPAPIDDDLSDSVPF